MSILNTIFAKLLYEMEKRHDTVLVTIISEDGSAPRGVGSQMLVGEQGRILGTVGGGAVERRSKELAMTLLGEKRSARHAFQLRKNETEDIGMVCGGDVEVLLQFISGTDSIWKTLAGKLVEQVQSRRNGWLIQRLDGGIPALLGENGELLAGETPVSDRSLLSSGGVCTEDYISLPLPVGERVVIFGAGHCGEALAPVLKSVGFRVTVFDDRAEFLTPDRFPDAEERICGDFLKVKEHLELNENDYVVVMTYGHSRDFEVQEQVLRQPLAYVGVIGSRSKTASVNRRLRESGVAEEAIRSVHTPIGMDIKSVTPEEIAVSIAGELIYVRALRREQKGVFVRGCPMH